MGKGGPLLTATFCARPNQFTVVVDLDGERVRAAMADRGRLREILIPGRPLLIERRDEPHRKTGYQIIAAQMPDKRLVSLDTHLPNRLVARALERGAIEGLPAYTRWRAEHRIGKSRFDFWLTHPTGPAVVLEVKSVGRIDPDRVARFPDAPTARGVRHLQELIHLHHPPERESALLFLIQGDHAKHVEVDVQTDPAFFEALNAASAAGIHLLAVGCVLQETGLSWGTPRPIRLG